MKKQTSIARRLAGALGLCAILFWLCAIGISGYVIRHELNEAFDQTLRQSALRLLPLAAHEFEDGFDGGDYEGEDDALFIADLNEEGANLDYYITDRSGHILVFASDERPSQSEIVIAPGFSTLNGAPAYALRDRETGIGIVVVERAGLRSKLLYESLLAMLLPLALLIPVLIVLTYFVVRAAMNPVWRLGKTISERHGRNLAPLSIGSQPSELAPIVKEVDSLLERLRTALEAERSFAAESAHELRTPIAGALAQVQVLRNTLQGTPNQSFAIQAEDALRHLATLSNDLLQSSRLEAGFASSATVEDLTPVIELILQEPEFATTKKRSNVAATTSVLVAYMEPDAFAIVLRNLLRNALLYADADTAIEISYGSDWLIVSNDCPPLDPSLLDRLHLRFVRGDETKKGSGLGLSIASKIVNDCDGTLTFASPTDDQNRGFAAKIEFTSLPVQE